MPTNQSTTTDLRPSRVARRRAGYRAGRWGFTLIELLVVLTVMVSLAGMLTYALASANTDARIKRTQADVLTIGQLLQTRMSEISLSKVNLTYGGGRLANASASVGGLGNWQSTRQTVLMAQERSRLILLARRDQLRMELPECRADLLYPPASLQFRIFENIPGSGPGWVPYVAQVKPPAAWARMRRIAGLRPPRELDLLIGAGNPVSDPTADGIAAAYDTSAGNFVAPFNQFSDGDLIDDGVGREWTRENESSECLFLILSATELFGQKAIDKIPSSSIGDTDGDGFREVLDAWGNPYEMIRSPVGLDNLAIKNFDATAATTANQFPPDPDPFDFLLVDWRFDPASFGTPVPNPLTPYHPFYAPPVVISSGRDGEFGIRRTFGVDDEVPSAVKEFYSASAVTIQNNAPVPRRSDMVYRYPDPYVDVSLYPSTGGHTSHPFLLTQIQTARQGGGLGGTTSRELAADNITSIDGDL